MKIGSIYLQRLMQHKSTNKSIIVIDALLGITRAGICSPHALQHAAPSPAMERLLSLVSEQWIKNKLLNL